MPYMFWLGHNAVEATKNICHAKGEGVADQSTIIQEILLVLQEPWQSGKVRWA